MPIAHVGSAELVELAEAKLHGDRRRKNSPHITPILQMPEPPDTVKTSVSLRDELLQVLPGDAALVDSGAA
ncbi:hypothetical protein KCP75_21970 [Salmonella enterica subsp. enterica]|nr:hypothetical protein KCP75_21970 [Salmonella enterica subsp. enterica]